MKFSALVIVVTAVAGVTAAPVESGPLANLQARASDAIGSFAHYIRSEQADTAAVPEVKRSPVRFHSGLGHENAVERRAKNPPPPPLNPFSTPSRDEKRSPDLTERSPAQKSVPPLNPFAAGGKASRV
ncbi:hypothetical protein CGRA01v4_14298 [Colletotrichum graminicola]|uniref:Uncharacterized protein n=1 Tax=Colletotrichum graminicola (strain M1.001 / M2 / FGSC 10212) TaxID=645133 RepID=E3Q5C6_COLGM|nr:uncharacterized protein GLRG_01037 [Colletotrichum graminicola M1.001]EFQ25893.1 hypothetical protein GLRG_01037 [Colletotrichum graminicola M1.001]WDK23007.1 hypothetical protein CGRA01v4_14298 [Colletotrichum graminicola]